MGGNEPVQVAQGIWWVGVRLPGDQFQCHAYYIDNGDGGILLDPGSPLTIEATLDKVAQIESLDAIAYLVCHHPDPDIAAGLRDLSDLPRIEDMAEALGFEVPAGLTQAAPSQAELALESDAPAATDAVEPMSPAIEPGEKIH